MFEIDWHDEILNNITLKLEIQNVSKNPTK